MCPIINIVDPPPPLQKCTKLFQWVRVRSRVRVRARVMVRARVRVSIKVRARARVKGIFLL